MIISHGITEKGNYEKYIRSVSNDRKLSISERGMLFTLLTIPEGFSFNANVISESVRETPMTIKKTVAKLEDKGYLHRKVYTREEAGYRREDIEFVPK